MVYLSRIVIEIYHYFPISGLLLCGSGATCMSKKNLSVYVFGLGGKNSQWNRGYKTRVSSSERSSMREDKSFLLPMGFLSLMRCACLQQIEGLGFVCLGVKESDVFWMLK